MRRRRRTRIVATLGPASSDADTLHKLFVAGADVFRINMSHTSHERMYELVRTIRAAEVEFGRPIAILADLQGPKLRLGPFAGGKANLTAGASFTLDSADVAGDASRVNCLTPRSWRRFRSGIRCFSTTAKSALSRRRSSPIGP
jgi:pyruvate kinase